MTQTYTIFHTEMMRTRSADGTISNPRPHLSVYKGFGSDPESALQDAMEDIAENQNDELQEDFSDDPGEYDSLLAIAVESLPGTWEVFPGVLTERPEGLDPILSESA